MKLRKRKVYKAVCNHQSMERYFCLVYIFEFIDMKCHLKLNSIITHIGRRRFHELCYLTSFLGQNTIRFAGITLLVFLWRFVSDDTRSLETSYKIFAESR